MRFKVVTDYPVALDSPDHINPLGTRMDNSRAKGFNEKVYELFNNRKPLKIMDLGCAGGGMVEDFVKDGHDAIGLEGSNYNLKHQRACWATISANLFTCDVSHRFQVYSKDKDPSEFGHHLEQEWFKSKFNVITGWEFMEHILPIKLPMVCANVKRHLHDDGIFVCSIPLGKEDNNPWHQCQKDFAWWKHLFDMVGLKAESDKLEDTWEPHQYVRGTPGTHNWRPVLRHAS